MKLVVAPDRPPLSLDRVRQLGHTTLRQAIPARTRSALRFWPRLLQQLMGHALPQQPDNLATLWVTRSSPLRRPHTTYGEALQAGKEANVRRAAAAHDGVVIPAGGEYSWHRQVGPPWRSNGFTDGPELVDDRIVPGPGGGMCQVANLLYALALRGGLTITERHRHSLDLFPDVSRSIPFGCGATVYFPHKDLRIRNPFPFAVQFRVTVSATAVVGELRAMTAPGFRCDIVERGHRFFRHDGQWWRENTLLRRFTFARADGTSLTREEFVAHNVARVLYPVPDDDAFAAPDDTALSQP